MRGVIDGRGPRARARTDRAARRRGAARRRARFARRLRRRTSTRFRSDRQPPMPGDRELEARLRHYVRWNALAMVVRANKVSSELGGHVASFASAATLYDVGFNHFFRAPSETFGGDLVFFQGHSSPGVYARAFLEGRISEEQLEHFRQEVDGNGLSSYPHPWLMPDFWQFPTVSMGLGPIMSIYQARFMRYLHDRGLLDSDRPQGVGVRRRRRDGRARIARRDLARRAREARRSDLGRQLQPAAARRSGARQRQDHSRARGRFQGRRLERHQGDLGQPLGSAARDRFERPARAADERVRRRRLSDVQIAQRQVRARRVLRPLSGDEGARRGLERRRDLGAAARRPRLAQGLRRLQSGVRTSRRSRRSCSPRRSKVTAWARPAKRRTSRTRRRRWKSRRCATFRDRFDLPISDAADRGEKVPFFKPPEDAPGDALPARARRRARQRSAAAPHDRPR